MQLSKKEKTFSDFFPPFSKSTLKFEHLEKNMNLIANVLMKIRIPKYVVRENSKISHFRRPYDKQQVIGRKHCSDLHESTFTIFIDKYEDN